MTLAAVGGLAEGPPRPRTRTRVARRRITAASVQSLSGDSGFGNRHPTRDERARTCIPLPDAAGRTAIAIGRCGGAEGGEPCSPRLVSVGRTVARPTLIGGQVRRGPPAFDPFGAFAPDVSGANAPKACKDRLSTLPVCRWLRRRCSGCPSSTRTQRSVLAVGLCVVLALGAAGSGMLAARSRPATLTCMRRAWRSGPAGAVVEVGADAALVPGSRVLAGMPDSLALARQQADWLAAGTVPQVTGPGQRSGPHRAARPARAEPGLRRTGGRVDAGLALCLAAGLGLRRVGPGPDRAPGRRRADPRLPGPGAAGVRRVPGALPAGRSGVPDERGVQLDGIGWALWACAQVAAEVPVAERPAFVARHRSLIDRSTGAALAMIDNRRGLAAAVRRLLGGGRDPFHAGDGGRAGGGAGVGRRAVRGGRRRAPEPAARSGADGVAVGDHGRIRPGRIPATPRRPGRQRRSRRELPAATLRGVRRSGGGAGLAAGGVRRWPARPAVWRPAVAGGATGSAGPTRPRRTR